MGIDLKLLVVWGEFGKEEEQNWLGHTVVSMGRDTTLFDAIEGLDRKELPEGCKLWSYLAEPEGKDDEEDSECTYGAVTKDCYDDPITWVTAGELAGAFDSVKDKMSCELQWNQAVHAFVKAMPKNLKIGLYWH